LICYAKCQCKTTWASLCMISTKIVTSKTFLRCKTYIPNTYFSSLNFFIKLNTFLGMLKHPTQIVMVTSKSLFLCFNFLLLFFYKPLKKKHDLQFEANKEEKMIRPFKQIKRKKWPTPLLIQNVFAMHPWPKTKKKNLTIHTTLPPQPQNKIKTRLLGCLISHLVGYQDFLFPNLPLIIFGLG